MLRPSVQPNCCNPPTNAFTRVGYSESFVEAGSSTPMRRIRSGCCACVVSGHTATEVPISVMKSRRLIAPGLREGDRTASNLALGAGGRHFAAMSALGQKRTHAAQQKRSLFDHLIGAPEERQRDCEAERRGGLEVQDQLDLGRLLHR